MLMALMSCAKVIFVLVHKLYTAPWKNLKARFELVDIETIQDVIKKYNECPLEENENPGDWVMQKNEIHLRLQIDFDKKDY